ncbi:hypothetical protein OAO87_01405 [bacterium]|nr:hypothetical protein [bacterium]
MLISRFEVLPGQESIVRWDEIVDSPSFLGLTTQYKLHQMTAVVMGLPDARFSCKEGAVKESFWEWREGAAGGESSLVRRAEQIDSRYLWTQVRRESVIAPRAASPSARRVWVCSGRACCFFPKCVSFIPGHI